MESPNRQAVKLLREQRKRRKRVAVFLGMAGIVVVGTVMALRMSGRAMNNQMLDCVLSHDLPHQHTEACYYTPPQEGAQKLLVCGTADFVVHKHDPKSCFDNMGNLICLLPEIEEHVHTNECYQEQKVLSCALEEGDGGHTHSESCWGPGYSAGPVCGLEETSGHTHDEDCYDEEGQLTCGQEESEGHTHSDSCYQTALICGMEEGAGGHIHSDACYTIETTIICGKREAILHTHNEDCYLHTVDQPNEVQMQELTEKGVNIDQVIFADPSTEELPAEENRVLDQSGAPILKCGQLQLLEHVHGDNCYTVIDTEGKLVSQLGSGSEGAEMPGQRTAVYQGASLRVTAIYDGGDFPENARISVERIDEEGGLPEKQEQLSKAMPNDELQLKALLKVTVAGVDEMPVLAEPIRLIVEPSQQERVTAAAWYDNSYSLSDQGIYVQSEDAKLELLEMTEQESGEFATEVYPGALVGIAQQPVRENEGDNGHEAGADTEVGQTADSVVLNISQSFEYEDDDYTMIFNVNGIARPKTTEDMIGQAGTEPADTSDAEPAEPADRSKPSEDEDSSEPEAADDVSTESTESDNGVYFTEPSTSNEQPDNSASEPAASDEPSATDEPAGTPEPDVDEGLTAEPTVEPFGDAEARETNVTIAGDVLPANVLDDPENPLGMLVERMDEDSQEYEMYADYAGDEDDENGLPGLKVMSYTMYYKGTELDISECTVTLKITAKEKLMAAAAELENMQETMASEDTELPSVTMLTIVPVETTEEDLAEDENEAEYSIPVTSAMLSQVDIETKILDIANENVSSDSPVVANAAAVLGDGTEPRTVKTVLRTAGKGRSGDGVDSDHFGVTAGTKDNPKFTVQYYAWLDVVNKNGSDLSVINTSGGKLPQNGTGEKISPNDNLLMGLNLVNNKIQTNSEWREIFSKVDSRYIQRPNLKFFKPVGTETFYNLKQIWILKDNGNSSGASYSADNWDVYGLDDLGDARVSQDKKVSSFDICHFTNKPHKIDEETKDYKPYQNDDGEWYFPIKDGAVIRLIFEPSSGSNPVDANFYDYDITDGSAKDKTEGTVGTSNYGINKYNGQEEYKENFLKDENGSDTEVKTKRYAFGNNNAGTNYGGEVWNGYNLNQANASSYGKCTYDIVQGIASNGNVIFNAGIDGPNLFGSYDNENNDKKEWKQFGRTDYDNSKMTFERHGDTYTLISAEIGDSTNSSLSSKSDLNSFTSRYYHKWTKQDNHTQKCSNPDCRVVASNNFWPLDSIYNDDLHFGNDPDNQTFKKGDSTAALPKNDDYGETGSCDHNSYFGMNFSVVFDLTTEYSGPLEYLFFGDDDMWVFLTPMKEVRDEKGNRVLDEDGKVKVVPADNPQLICDIGGVHSSVGEYVDLWDYVGYNNNKSPDDFIKNPDYLTTEDDEEFHGIAHYKLDFFYTERGASGSTCWMQYTLPSVRSATKTQTNDEMRRLEIKKEVTKTAVSGEFSEGKTEQYGDSEDEFLFKLTLNVKEGEVNKPLNDNYSYYKYKIDGSEETDKETDKFEAILLDPDVVCDGAYFTLKHGEYIVIDHLPIGTIFTIQECGVYGGYELKDGKVYFKFKKGEYNYEESATITQGNSGSQPMKPEFDEDGKKFFKGEIIDNVSASVVFDNNFKTYELPKTGGAGAWGLTGAGLLLMLAAGCLLVRKRA